MKIAIIGAGISGLGAAYLLAPGHDIAVYEKNNYPGGHSRTVEVPGRASSIPVDTGFIVFNNWNYPNLLGLFKALDVPYQKSDMSFGVSIDHGWLEYASGGMLAQKLNMAVMCASLLLSIMTSSLCASHCKGEAMAGRHK